MEHDKCPTCPNYGARYCDCSRKKNQSITNRGWFNLGMLAGAIITIIIITLTSKF